MQINDPSEIPMSREIEAQTDRGAAVISVAWVEVELTRAIRAKLRKDVDATNMLLKPSGPLGAYATKVNAAYLLRIFGKLAKRDLLIMGEIRNKFAHHVTPHNFVSKEIRPICEKIEILDRIWHLHPNVKDRMRPFDQAIARRHFIECASIAAVQLRQFCNNPDISRPAEMEDLIW